MVGLVARLSSSCIRMVDTVPLMLRLIRLFPAEIQPRTQVQPLVYSQARVPRRHRALVLRGGTTVRAECWAQGATATGTSAAPVAAVLAAGLGAAGDLAGKRTVARATSRHRVRSAIRTETWRARCLRWLRLCPQRSVQWCRSRYPYIVGTVKGLGAKMGRCVRHFRFTILNASRGRM